MKLEEGDKIVVHGHIDVPLEDGLTYKLTGTDGSRYVFRQESTGTSVQCPYPAVDKHLGTESYIERV